MNVCARNDANNAESVASFTYTSGTAESRECQNVVTIFERKTEYPWFRGTTPVCVANELKNGEPSMRAS